MAQIANIQAIVLSDNSVVYNVVIETEQAKAIFYACDEDSAYRLRDLFNKDITGMDIVETQGY